MTAIEDNVNYQTYIAIFICIFFLKILEDMEEVLLLLLLFKGQLTFHTYLQGRSFLTSFSTSILFL